MFVPGIFSYWPMIETSNDRTCTRSFKIGLKLAEGQKLECFKLTANDILQGQWKASKPIL